MAPGYGSFRKVHFFETVQGNLESDPAPHKAAYVDIALDERPEAFERYRRCSRACSGPIERVAVAGCSHEIEKTHAPPPPNHAGARRKNERHYWRSY